MSRGALAARHAATLRAGLVALMVLLSCGCDGSSPEVAGQTTQPALAATLVNQGGGAELLQLPHGGLPGLTLSSVRATALPSTLVTTGQITFDDRRVANIISRVAGRIEEVRVSQWDLVRRGQPILTLYSPDFMTAEAEYLQARASVAALAAGGGDSAQFAHAMVAAAARKLALLGIGPEQIATISTAAPTFVMRAPISGTVVQNQALRGSAVNPGDVLFGVGTLDDVWITGDIFEDDVARVRVGQSLEAVTTAYPDEVFHGVVERISPGVDPATHTLQLRCRVNNPGLKLKPQMLAQVTVDVLDGTAVIVPREALVFATDSYFAYVAAGNDRFVRREVLIGPWNQAGYARVIRGLVPGDQVVAGGALQVDQLWHEAHGESS